MLQCLFPDGRREQETSVRTCRMLYSHSINMSSWSVGKQTNWTIFTLTDMGLTSIPCPHLGLSDHIAIILIPAYRLLLKMEKLIKRTIAESVSVLQHCFEWTISVQGGHHKLRRYRLHKQNSVNCMSDASLPETKQLLCMLRSMQHNAGHKSWSPPRWAATVCNSSRHEKDSAEGQPP